MKVWIHSEEWYPVFRMNVEPNIYEWSAKDEYSGKIKDINEEEYQRRKKIFDDFIALQKELAGLIGSRFLEDKD